MTLRGVAISPAQVDTVLAELPGCGPEFQAIIDRDGAGRDSITVRVEAEDRPGLRDELARRLRVKIGLRVAVESAALTGGYP